ncbi:hypothetical protein POTOM_057048 [Populus tomentosa]|uniref:Uncharacterized protein n=1 Tax=Populus tomentosa TaxID=118781 RepID=A0A8X7XVS2_POPTO|nr:hypothetical protein POTOM_057048 [Populus tomentosa]
MKLTTTIKKKKKTLFFNSTIYGLLRENLKRIEESLAGPKPNSQSNKSVERVPVPIKQRDSRSYATVVQAGNKNNPSSAVEEFKEVSDSPSLCVQLIIHDPTEEDVALRLNGTDYLVNIQELSTLHFPVFEAIKYDMKAFNLMRGEEDDDQSPVVMERETAVTSNRKAMTEEVIDCWINIWDMRSRDAAITDVI